MGNGSSYVDGEGTGAGIAGRRGLAHGWQHVKAFLVAELVHQSRADLVL